MEAGRHHRPRSFGIPRFQSDGTTKIVKFQSQDADFIVNNITAALMELDLCGHIIFSAYGDKILVDILEAMNWTGITMISVPPVWLLISVWEDWDGIIQKNFPKSGMLLNLDIGSHKFVSTGYYVIA